MTPQRWQLLNQIFQGAVELPESERPAFLDKACASDVTLRAEVEALLASSTDGSPLAEAVGIAAADYISTPESSPAPGQRFGRYEITGRLGSGGTGHVYRAFDTRLGRDVALKVLARQYTADSFRLNRFQREARLVSALNHPNLLMVHELGEIDGRQFIGMELVEGRTLHAEIAGGPIAASRALEIVMQAAGALAAAHQAGIVHRDIKPENIMVRVDGFVKVLDFGTAKLTETAPAGAKPKDPMATIPGTLVGTVEYMSPEQACGRPVDARSDIFSLGVVLYELLAGGPPFRGETRTDTLALILQAAVPPIPARMPEVPAELERIVGKMLARKAEDRQASMNDLQAELMTVREDLDAPAAMPPSAAPRDQEAAGAAPRPTSRSRGAVSAIVAGAAAIGKRLRGNNAPRAGE
ncbi:MAG TPA: serine/threonine-protein kinase [Verrucomicrobiae bacterium]|nr:serine/threonine-protein kinase [Verrucomicrobiae bacterium]